MEKRFDQLWTLMVTIIVSIFGLIGYICVGPQDRSAAGRAAVDPVGNRVQTRPRSATRRRLAPDPFGEGAQGTGQNRRTPGPGFAELFLFCSSVIPGNWRQILESNLHPRIPNLIACL